MGRNKFIDIINFNVDFKNSFHYLPMKIAPSQNGHLLKQNITTENGFTSVSVH